MRVISDPIYSEANVLLALKEAFVDSASSELRRPPQSLVELPAGGDVISYPAVLPAAGPGVFTVKVSPYLPQPDGSSIVTAWTLLMSLATGRPIAIVDAAQLTVERTAATTALAVDALLGANAHKVAIIGVGALGRAHARYVRHVRPGVEIVGYSRSATASTEGICLASDLASAVEGADAVLLCTSAAETVIDPRELPAGTLVTSISTNAPGAREVPPEAVASMDVYVDALSTIEVAEELRAAVAHGWAPSRIRGGLAELLSGQAPPPSGDRPIYFRSVGLGLEDAAVAWAAVEHEMKEESGGPR